MISLRNSLTLTKRGVSRWFSSADLLPSRKLCRKILIFSVGILGVSSNLFISVIYRNVALDGMTTSVLSSILAELAHEFGSTSISSSSAGIVMHFWVSKNSHMIGCISVALGCRTSRVSKNKRHKLSIDS